MNDVKSWNDRQIVQMKKDIIVAEGVNCWEDIPAARINSLVTEWIAENAKAYREKHQEMLP